MSLQRLKHAYARGARIQYQPDVGEWRDVAQPMWANFVEYRVHPGDAALEYGPISTALRQMAAMDTDRTKSIHRAAMDMEDEYLHDSEVQDLIAASVRNPGAVVMFRLMVAEAFADEGL